MRSGAVLTSLKSLEGAATPFSCSRYWIHEKPFTFRAAERTRGLLSARADPGTDPHGQIIALSNGPGGGEQVSGLGPDLGVDPKGGGRRVDPEADGSNVRRHPKPYKIHAHPTNHVKLVQTGPGEMSFQFFSPNSPSPPSGFPPSLPTHRSRAPVSAPRRRCSRVAPSWRETRRRAGPRQRRASPHWFPNCSSASAT